MFHAINSSTTANETLTALADLVDGLQPKARADALAATLKQAATAAGDLPLTGHDLIVGLTVLWGVGAQRWPASTACPDDLPADEKPLWFRLVTLREMGEAVARQISGVDGEVGWQIAVRRCYRVWREVAERFADDQSPRGQAIAATWAREAESLRP